MKQSDVRGTRRAPRPMMRVGARTLSACVLVLLVCAGCQRRGTAAHYGTAAVTRGDLQEYVTASGTLSALVSVDVGSQVSGKITALHADFNSPVKKGQLIAEIDPSVYQASLQQAEGDLASAQADAVLKQQNLARKKFLVPLHAAAQLDLDQATAELAQAKATVVIKQAVLDSARANLSYCKITSPVDGVVISRKVDVGQTLVAAMTTPVLFTIAKQLTKMNISAAVSEADIGQVHDDQSVDFTVDAFPDEVFHGQVVQVRRSPTTTSNVVTYETIIGVDNPQQKLFPGMTADVSILVARQVSVLKIPNAALRYTPPADAVFTQAPPLKLQRGARLIYTLDAAASELRPVVIQIGITDGVDTEVVRGLSEGVAVVTSTLASSRPLNPFAGGQPPPPPPPQ
ncbi:MAG TPA: efflux RND transporter periplasmic adaptor subunit [Steroidobacteraceae bacterium]|jgi:HlyD family secretion protein|nr:efflux RND transporter periplasmic adaptor subunit [Steroidobacteraceae bacterium]